MNASSAGAAVLAACLLVLPGVLDAQLLSPGKLAEPHAELEGLRNCTSCHQLGKPGVSAERCLSCHEEVAVRMNGRRGYHASLPVQDCASCHQDHLGEGFALVRFDERSLDHAGVGFALELSHAALDCRTCHQPSLVSDPLVIGRKAQHGRLDRTFLGLPTDCAGCHHEVSPHGEQFGRRGCADCHDAAEWEEPTRFDHSATAFALGGRHAQVGCARCHGAGKDARYRPLAFGSCSDCHADPHRGAMSGTCSSCHGTSGWHTVREGALGRSFDHAATRFPLRGAHASADCAACHRTGRPPSGELVHIAYRAGTASRSYPLPVAEACASCHVDRHVATASPRRWQACAECHSEVAWAPSSFGLAAHERSGLPLTGAHAAAPCVACHQDRARGHARFHLALGAQSCAGCHAADDPHEGRYGSLACETCHGTEVFGEAAFDHVSVSVAAEPRGCLGCHAADDPHAGQFEGSDCASCHGTDTYAIPFFDHAATRFPLDGAHDGAPCASCHVRDASDGGAVRYRPLGTECADCHAVGHGAEARRGR
jgi:hypothetical protein